MSTLTSSMMVGGVSLTLVISTRPNAHVVSLNFSTLLSPSPRWVNPSTPSNTIDQSGGVVALTPSAPFTSSPFLENTQSAPSFHLFCSRIFVEWEAYYSIHTYVGPSPTYVAMSSGNQNPFPGFSFQTSSQVLAAPFGISPFSLFSGGNLAPTFATPASVGTDRTTYHTLQASNNLEFGWNPFQNNATTS